MTLTGKDADEFLEALKNRNQKEHVEALEQAKAEAAKRGKEPFDLAKLEQLCDTSSEGRLAPLDERRDRFEYMYYVNNPSIMTIAEFAAYVDRVNKW
jgi:hypothetical protein